MSDKVCNEVGAVQSHSKVVSVCHDAHSLWVQVAGPAGGNAWTMAPGVAREVASLLVHAADQADGLP